LCNCCGAWLIFQTSRAGEMVNCPECFMGTMLYVPDQFRSRLHPDADFEIRKIKWTLNRFDCRFIQGELVHRGKNGLDWVRIQFTLYNGLVPQVGPASDSLVGCSIGRVWKFQAPVHDPLVVRAPLPIIPPEFGRVYPEMRPPAESAASS